MNYLLFLSVIKQKKKKKNLHKAGSNITIFKLFNINVYLLLLLWFMSNNLKDLFKKEKKTFGKIKCLPAISKTFINLNIRRYNNMIRSMYFEMYCLKNKYKKNCREFFFLMHHYSNVSVII